MVRLVYYLIFYGLPILGVSIYILYCLANINYLLFDEYERYITKLCRFVKCLANELEVTALEKN